MFWSETQLGEHVSIGREIVYHSTVIRTPEVVLSLLLRNAVP